jgi:phosphate transport system substrate-binding protein
MKFLRRAIVLSIAALVLFTTLAPNAAMLSYAQDTNTVTVDGSNIASPVLKAASQAYIAAHPDVKIEVNVSGTSGGFEKLCNGTLDVNMAVRGITDAEAAACQGKTINYVELLLGYDALVVVVNTASPATCLTKEQLDKLLGPNSADVKNWNVIDPALADSAISAIYSTGPDSQVGVLASSLITGEKLRADVQPAATYDDIEDKINTDLNAIGIMTLADWQKPKKNRAVRAVQLKNNTTCVDPSIPSIAEARYTAAESVYLYVNAASLDRKPVADFLSYLLSEEGRKSVATSGFVLAENTTYDRGQTYLTTKQTGRTFSRIQTVNVPPDTAGIITVDGSPATYQVFKSVSSAFSPRYASIKLNVATYGDEAGLRKLCSNTVDMIGTDRLPTDAEAAVCQQANVQTLRLKLGTRAVVLAVNGNNNFATCLTTEEIGKLFAISSENTVKKWSDVRANMPGTDLLLLTPTDGAVETDLLLNGTVKGLVAPVIRKDVTQNSDALYRGAATQNVEGAITYMLYSDFKNLKSTVKAVAVNSGTGCVEPSEDNITNGIYPLSQTLYATLNLNTISRPELKAFVWYLLSDDALTIIHEGLLGTDTAAFVAAREVVLARFAGQDAAITTQPGAATPAATTAATQDVSSDPATPVATPAATQDAGAATPASTAAQ